MHVVFTNYFWFSYFCNTKGKRNKVKETPFAELSELNTGISLSYLRSRMVDAVFLKYKSSVFNVDHREIWSI